MKKEYHYTISRTDRIYLIAFVIFLLGWELVKGIIPVNHNDYTYIPQERHDTGSEPWVKKKKSFSNYNPYKKWPERKYIKADGTAYPINEHPSSPVLIDSATVEELRSMGFSNKVSFNITKFIAAGGKITGPDAIMKIYGMDSVQLQRSSPYIIYSKSFDKKVGPETNANFSGNKTSKILDLNFATASELESLPGIGKVLAERIVKFRESLGGFVNPAQLKDCYGISPELYEQLKDQLAATGSPKKININQDDLTGVNHPYVPRKITKVISAYIRQHGPVRSVDDLMKAYPVDTGWVVKALPYLDFEAK